MLKLRAHIYRLCVLSVCGFAGDVLRLHVRLTPGVKSGGGLAGFCRKSTGEQSECKLSMIVGLSRSFAFIESRLTINVALIAPA